MDPVLNKSAFHQIPVAMPSITEAEEREVAHALSSKWISTGPKVAQFEQEFAEAHGARFGVACCSGTSALHLALAAAGVFPGDRVVLPTLTMVACANAVLYCGATPIFVDSDANGNMSEAQTREAVKFEKGSPRVQAVMPVHLYGQPVEWISELTSSIGPWLIEDCAEAHYARFSGGAKPVGSVGRFACFSFYANKIITCGEGGMALCHSEQDAERLRSLRSHAFTPGDHFHHQGLAFGYRMTDIQAAVGLVQHRRRHWLIEQRARCAMQHDRASSVYWVSRPGFIGLDKSLTRPLVGAGPNIANWVWPVLVNKDASFTRDQLRECLAINGVDTRNYFVPMHRQQHLKQYAEGRIFPVADDLAARGFYLPLYPDLTNSQIDWIWTVISKFARSQA